MKIQKITQEMIISKSLVTFVNNIEAIKTLEIINDRITITFKIGKYRFWATNGVRPCTVSLFNSASALKQNKINLELSEKEFNSFNPLEFILI